MGSLATVRHSIRTRILAVLGVMGAASIVLLAVIEFTALTTHRHTELVSEAIFPATLELQQAQASFAELQRHYKESVLLEDQSALAEADREAGDTVARLNHIGTMLSGPAPELALRASGIAGQLSINCSRAHSVYQLMISSRGNINDGLQAGATAVTADNNRLTELMQQLNQTLGAQGRDEFRLTSQWSVWSRAAGWAGLALSLIAFGLTWWILEIQVIAPLDRLGRRMKDIAQGEGDLTGRVDVRGHNELDEVGRWFNTFIARVEQIVIEVALGARAVTDAAAALSAISGETASRSGNEHDQAASIADTMAEISVSVRQISETTQTAARDAHTAEQNANTGADTIRATVTSIQQLLADNQRTASKIEELGRASMTQVENGVASARSAGDALASILEGSEALQQMVTEIAAAATQQSQATQSVNGNVQEITRIIELTTVSSTRAVDACGKLSSLAANLNRLVGVFKVGAAATAH